MEEFSARNRSSQEERETERERRERQSESEGKDRERERREKQSESEGETPPWKFIIYILLNIISFKQEPFIMCRRNLLFIFFPFLISFSAFSQPDKAEAEIQAMMQEIKVVGLSVAVVKNNKIIYTHSFGLKDMDSNAPLTDDCLFRIASISKSFSATSIMQLVEAGKLSLEDDMS
jgi:hypothetical protein